MKCSEVRRLFNYASEDGRSGDAAARSEATFHLRACQNCRQDLALESLSSALLQAHRSKADSDIPEPHFLMARIRARIRELGEQGVGSWESAVLSMRGWVLALGAAALLLVSISLQWQLPNAINAADHDNDVTSLSGIGDDFLSGNLGAVPETANSYSTASNYSNEAGSHDHK